MFLSYVDAKPEYSKTCLKRPPAFSDQFFMHGESTIQTGMLVETGIFCTNDQIFPVFGDQKQGKALLCPHIYCENSHHNASLRANHRMRPALAPDWRELSLRRSNSCAPQPSELFNRASKNRSVSGKPCLRDHLSITTIFPCTVGWSLKTGFTVCILWLIKFRWRAQQRHKFLTLVQDNLILQDFQSDVLFWLFTFQSTMSFHILLRRTWIVQFQHWWCVLSPQNVLFTITVLSIIQNRTGDYRNPGNFSKLINFGSKNTVSNFRCSYLSNVFMSFSSGKYHPTTEHLLVTPLAPSCQRSP